MNEAYPTIIQLSEAAGRRARAMSARAGLDQHSPILFGMASGFDVAITLFEESTGTPFRGLAPESAARVVQYFRDEATRSEQVDGQIALFYRSWADTIAATYLKK